MTRRTDRIIELLGSEVARGRRPPPAAVAATLRAHGLLPSEAGWVLHHVFDIEMPEAVHMATVVGAHEAARGTVAKDEWPPTHASV